MPAAIARPNIKAMQHRQTRASLWAAGLDASSTMSSRSALLQTEMTCRPRPAAFQAHTGLSDTHRTHMPTAAYSGRSLLTSAMRLTLLHYAGREHTG